MLRNHRWLSGEVVATMVTMKCKAAGGRRPGDGEARELAGGSLLL